MLLVFLSLFRLLFIISMSNFYFGASVGSGVLAVCKDGARVRLLNF